MIPLVRDRHSPGIEPLTEFSHQFVRSPVGQYVHRPRSGAQYQHGIRLNTWCGMSMSGYIAADRVVEFGPHAELCGTCEGRFLGSLDNTGLIFQPSNSVDHWRPGTIWCPGDRQGLYVVTGPGNAAVCLLCGAYGTERRRGGWYGGHSAITKHRYASERPKVFCPTCGIRDLQLYEDSRTGKYVIKCSTFRCDFQTQPFKANAGRRHRGPLLPPAPGETSYPLPPPQLKGRCEQGPDDIFDDLI